MTLIMTVFVPEGLVMAADSRLTLTFGLTQPPGSTGPQQVLSIPSSDSTYKLFVTKRNVGIAMCGTIGTQGEPLAPIVERLASNQLAAMEPAQVADGLKTHLRTLPGPPQTWLQVAGYGNDGNKQVLLIDVSADTVTPVDLTKMPSGVRWNGETDVLLRLLNRAFACDDQGNAAGEHASYSVAWSYFTLQDAVDFAVYSIRTTADTMRFQLRSQTVGGPIDVLVIRPSGAEWLHRKELRVTDTE